MQEIAISKFKATCLATLQRVRKTGKPILVTRFGVPVAEIVPPPETRSPGWLGSLAGSGNIVGDIVSAAVEPDEWHVLKS